MNAMSLFRISLDIPAVLMVYVHVHACMYALVHVSVLHANVHMGICAYMSMCVCVCVCVCVRVNVYM